MLESPFRTLGTEEKQATDERKIRYTKNSEGEDGIMIGPCKKKMPDKLVCTSCDVLISKKLGGTVRFPKKRTVNYCSHKDLGGEGLAVSFIKGFPYTPKWCPVLIMKGKTDA